LQSPLAYLLVFHGSSDPRSRQTTEQLAELFAQRISYSGSFEVANSKGFGVSDRHPISEPVAPIVEIAALEGDCLALHQKIEQLGIRLQQQSHVPITPQIVVLPLFLLQGIHVMEDIPAEVAQAQEVLGQAVRIAISPHLGSHPGLYRLITERMAALPVEAWILLAHGSRRPVANQFIESLAERLGAVTAYWSVAPDLETRLHELRELGLKRIAILPYFLSQGGITDAIAQQVTTFSQQFPSLELHLTSPLNSASELVDLIIDLATE
jgi:sirohydrochlorin ferrochelatase